MFKKLFIFVLVLNVIGLDGYVGYKVFQFNSLPVSQFEEIQVKNTSDVVTYRDECGEVCKKEIAKQVGQLSSLPVLQSSPTVKPLVKNQVKTRKEEIFTIAGNGGSTMSNDWTDIPGSYFYFDTRDYPGILEVYFEANMSLVNGNGYAYTRLFDVTNGIGLDGSENNTNSQTNVWTKSQKINFWAGRNLIQVQARSLTADTAVFSGGRLRIVTLN